MSVTPYILGEQEKARLARERVRAKLERDLGYITRELEHQANLMNALNFSFDYVPHDSPTPNWVPHGTFEAFAVASRLVLQLSEAKRIIEARLAE